MKAKIKSTGEMVEVKPCKDLIEAPVEMYEDESGTRHFYFQLEFDWEQMRHNMAKDFTAVMLGRLKETKFIANSNCNPYRLMAEIAVKTADAVIEELKKPKNQEKREQ